MSGTATTPSVRRALSLLGLAAALAFTVASPAFAEEETVSNERSIELYNDSLRRYREGRFKEAADLLRELYRAKPVPVLLYNLGRACEGMEDLECAVLAYTRYLSEEPEIADRGAIEQRVETLRRQQRERSASKRKRGAGQRPTVPIPDSARTAPPNTRGPSAVPWIVAGVGAAGIGTGLFLGVLAQNKHDDAVDEPVQQSAASKQAEAEHLATGANVALISGGLIAVAGAVWGIWEIRLSRTQAVSGAPAFDVRAGLNGARLSASF
jgi:hypothetical protein